jgi:hypothetical protein
MKKSQVMVKERYTGFQLHRVNDSDDLNVDDIDYAFAANGSRFLALSNIMIHYPMLLFVLNNISTSSNVL